MSLKRFLILYCFLHVVAISFMLLICLETMLMVHKQTNKTILFRNVCLDLYHVNWSRTDCSGTSSQQLTNVLTKNGVPRISHTYLPQNNDDQEVFKFSPPLFFFGNRVSFNPG